jgi:hypothetical protein
MTGKRMPRQNKMLGWQSGGVTELWVHPVIYGEKGWGKERGREEKRGRGKMKRGKEGNTERGKHGERERGHWCQANLCYQPRVGYDVRGGQGALTQRSWTCGAPIPYQERARDVNACLGVHTFQRDNVVYWKTKRKINDDLQCN